MTLRSRIPEIAAELDEEMDSAIRNLVELIVSEAKARVRYGMYDPHLRDAIHDEKLEDGNWRVVAGGSGAWYGHIVEFGSANSAPHPFLLPALESQRQKLDELAKLALRNLG